MAFKLPNFGNGNTALIVGGVLLGIGLYLGSQIGKGGLKYVDKYTGGIIPDEFTQYGSAESDVTFYFPEFNQRVVIA